MKSYASFRLMSLSDHTSKMSVESLTESIFSPLRNDLSFVPSLEEKYLWFTAIATGIIATVAVAVTVLSSWTRTPGERKRAHCSGGLVFVTGQDAIETGEAEGVVEPFSVLPGLLVM